MVNLYFSIISAAAATAACDLSPMREFSFFQAFGLHDVWRLLKCTNHKICAIIYCTGSTPAHTQMECWYLAMMTLLWWWKSNCYAGINAKDLAFFLCVLNFTQRTLTTLKYKDSCPLRTCVLSILIRSIYLHVTTFTSLNCQAITCWYYTRVATTSHTSLVTKLIEFYWQFMSRLHD